MKPVVVVNAYRRPLQRSLLLDVGVAPEVESAFRALGCDVSTLAEAGLLDAPSREIIEAANRQDRVFVTHDGELLSRISNSGISHAGVIYLRRARFTVEAVVSYLQRLGEQDFPILERSFLLPLSVPTPRSERALHNKGHYRVVRV